MAKLFVVQNSNSNMSISSEWDNNPQGAMTAFHNLCAALWNDAGAVQATVKIMDEQLDCYNGKSELIEHDAKKSTKSSK